MDRETAENIDSHMDTLDIRQQIMLFTNTLVAAANSLIILDMLLYKLKAATPYMTANELEAYSIGMTRLQILKMLQAS